MFHDSSVVLSETDVLKFYSLSLSFILFETSLVNIIKQIKRVDQLKSKVGFICRPSDSRSLVLEGDAKLEVIEVTKVFKLFQGKK